MKIKPASVARAIAFALSLGTASASAATIEFSGAWSESLGFTGTIAPGVGWTANAGGTQSWGVPGVGLGTLAWPGGDGFRDFHITFEGVTIDATFGDTCVGGAGGGTVFCSLSPAAVWEPELGPNSISFFAPDGETLDAGESFFVNIMFANPSPEGSFTGSWTMDGGVVPEPGSLALLGIALAGLGFARRKLR